MQRYIYTARDNQGKVIKGVMNAENELELAEKVHSLGYFLTNFKIVDQEKFLEIKMPKMKQKEILQFTIQLAALIEAGLPLLEALQSLIQDAQNERVKKIIEDIASRVEGGDSLKEAFSFHPKSFSKLYVAIVGAGEATGKLSQSLRDLANFLEWQMDLKSRIKEAATYPFILFCVMVGVVSLLVTKVLPKFKLIFDSANISLPVFTQILLNVSYFVSRFWYIGVAVIFLLILGYKTYNATEKGRYFLDTIKLKLPLFGELIRKIALLRFSHTLALASRAGINLLSALDIAKETLTNLRLKKAVAKAKDSVNMGERLANSLRETGEFPAMVVRMVSVGERSGSLVESLMRVADFYNKEVSSTIKKIFALSEPIMIVIMGIIVGTIALAIFLPIFKMVRVMGV